MKLSECSELVLSSTCPASYTCVSLQVDREIIVYKSQHDQRKIQGTSLWEQLYFGSQLMEYPCLSARGSYLASTPNAIPRL